MRTRLAAILGAVLLIAPAGRGGDPTLAELRDGVKKYEQSVRNFTVVLKGTARTRSTPWTDLCEPHPIDLDYTTAADGRIRYTAMTYYWYESAATQGQSRLAGPVKIRGAFDGVKTHKSEGGVSGPNAARIENRFSTSGWYLRRNDLFSPHYGTATSKWIADPKAAVIGSQTTDGIVAYQVEIPRPSSGGSGNKVRLSIAPARGFATVRSESFVKPIGGDWLVSEVVDLSNYRLVNGVWSPHELTRKSWDAKPTQRGRIEPPQAPVTWQLMTEASFRAETLTVNDKLDDKAFDFAFTPGLKVRDERR